MVKRLIFLALGLVFIASMAFGEYLYINPHTNKPDYYEGTGTLDSEYLKLDCSNDPLTNVLDGAAATFTGLGTFDKLSLTNTTASYDDIISPNPDFGFQSTYSGAQTYVQFWYGAPAGKNIEVYYSADGGAGGWSPWFGWITTASRVIMDATHPFGIRPNSHGDDYIQFQTINSIPEITTVGSCNLKINPDGGTLDLPVNIVQGDGTYSWGHSPNVGFEGILEVDGMIYGDGGFTGALTGNADTVTNGVYTTTANYVTLTDDSMADTLHRHSELSASDGSPDRALIVDAAGKVGIGTANPGTALEVNGAITGTSLTDGTATLSGGNLSGADVDISAGTGDYSSSGTLGAGAITGTSLDAGSGTIETTGTGTFGDFNLDVAYEAGENIDQYDAVCLKPDGKIWLAQSDADATARAIGITPEAITNGNTGAVRVAGHITDTGWSWTVGALVYVDYSTGGALTETPVGRPHMTGLAVSATTVYINPFLPTLGVFTVSQLNTAGVNIYSDKIYVRANAYLGIGSSGEVKVKWTRVGTYGLFTGLQGTDSYQWIISDENYIARNFDHAIQSNPTIFLHSATDPNTNNTQWMSLTHNQTDGIIATGAGDLQLLPATGFVGIGTAPTVALDVTGDIKCSVDYYQGANQGLSATYTFGGGASGDIASMTFSGGILTGVTTVP